MNTEDLKILVIKPNALGDIVMSLPALDCLRRHFPNAKIHWLVRPEFATLLQNHPQIDELVIFDRKFLGKAWRKWGAFKELWALLRRIKQTRYNIVIDLQGLFRTGFMTWISGSKRRLGMRQVRELAWLFYTEKALPPGKQSHIVDRYLNTVALTGAEDADCEFVLPSSSASADSIRQMLEAENISPSNYAVFMAGSAHISKCWPAENFGKLAEKLAADYSLPVVAVGDESDFHFSERIRAAAGSKIVNFCGRTNISELIEILRAARLVVGDDTGAGHIATALAVPSVFIFGPSNPNRIGPYKRPDSVVCNLISQRPMKTKSSDSKFAIEKITVEQVYDKIRQTLGATEASVGYATET